MREYHVEKAVSIDIGSWSNWSVFVVDSLHAKIKNWKLLAVQPSIHFNHHCVSSSFTETGLGMARSYDLQPYWRAASGL